MQLYDTVIIKLWLLIVSLLEGLHIKCKLFVIISETLCAHISNRDQLNILNNISRKIWNYETIIQNAIYTLPKKLLISCSTPED